MGFVVNTGTLCMCSFGSCPTPFSATPSCNFCCKTPIGTIFDMVPGMNIVPFGVCAVLSGGPCVVAPLGPWIQTKPNLVFSTKKPILTLDCQLQCALGGIIKLIPTSNFTNNVK